MKKRNKFRQSVAQQEEGRAPKIFLPQGPEEAKSATVVWCVPWVVHTPYADHIKYFNFTMHSAIMLIIVWLTSIYNSHVCAPPSIYRHISHRIAGWGECVWLCCIDYAPCEPRVCVLCVFAWARFFFFLFACATPLSRIPIAGTELTWWCFSYSHRSDAGCIKWTVWMWWYFSLIWRDLQRNSAVRPRFWVCRVCGPGNGEAIYCCCSCYDCRVCPWTLNTVYDRKYE